VRVRVMSRAGRAPGSNLCEVMSPSSNQAPFLVSQISRRGRPTGSGQPHCGPWSTWAEAPFLVSQISGRGRPMGSGQPHCGPWSIWAE
jgi:hypothetical protein